MPQVINTNISSLNAQRNMNSSQTALATSLQRLSSGMRINSAKDDAAGLAISERFTTQIRGLNQAARNANDGISLAQTAEGALGEVSTNLQRIRELAVQSRNATNSTDDRAALQKEVAQLKLEIDRVANDTSFNGTKLLDGSFRAQAFQIGANQGQTINIDAIADTNIAELGTWKAATYTQKTAAVGAVTGDHALAMSMDINGVTVASATGAADAGAAVSAFVTAFGNAKTANPTALAGVTMAADGTISTTGASLTLANLSNISGVTAGTTNSTATAIPGLAQTGFKDLDISDVGGADAAILAMDGALKAVNGSRADLGAIQNRFQSVISNLATASENLTASRSRIQDADFAAETAALTRNQILQQAGVAMLSQANSLPQNVLSLLR